MEYKTEEDMFNIIKTNFTANLYNWMKAEFSDVCSNGDVCINKLLDELNSIYNIKNKTDVSCDMRQVCFINYIYDRYINNYLKGDAPDPFWAD